jgi:hypothetical protein
MSGGGGGACFIVVAPVQWRYHGGPYLAVPVVAEQRPLDVRGLLGNQGAVQTFTVRWNDESGVGIEFHTLVGCAWNAGTRAVMEELGIPEEAEEPEEPQELVCTIITRPGKLPLSREIYEWFSGQCKRSLY